MIDVVFRIIIRHCMIQGLKSRTVPNAGEGMISGNSHSLPPEMQTGADTLAVSQKTKHTLTIESVVLLGIHLKELKAWSAHRCLELF